MVGAVDDAHAEPEGRRRAAVLLAVRGDDAVYAALRPRRVEVQVRDDDEAGVALAWAAPSSRDAAGIAGADGAAAPAVAAPLLSEEHSDRPATRSVALLSKPRGDVVVEVQASSGACVGPDGWSGKLCADLAGARRGATVRPVRTVRRARWRGLSFPRPTGTCRKTCWWEPSMTT